MLNKELEVQKVIGEENPADLLTKHVNESKRDKYCQNITLEAREGRSSISLDLQQGGAAAGDTTGSAVKTETVKMLHMFCWRMPRVVRLRSG